MKPSEKEMESYTEKEKERWTLQREKNKRGRVLSEITLSRPLFLSLSLHCLSLLLLANGCVTGYQIKCDKRRCYR